MLEVLTIVLMASAAQPLPSSPPAGCRIAVEAADDESVLVVRSGAAEARHVLTSAELPSTPGETEPPPVTALALPAGGDVVYAALAERWDGLAPAGIGRLYRIRCGPEPSVAVSLVEPGVDFGRIAVLRDGRWIVGGWGGLRVLDPTHGRLVPLTSPPPFPAPGCWTAEEDEPAPAADVPLVGDGGVALPARADRGNEGGASSEEEEEVAFLRGGACGYEAEMTATRHALRVARGTVRPVKAIRAFAMTEAGRMLVGDGGGTCDEASGGLLWSSVDGERWEPIEIRKNGKGGVAQLARLGNDGPWLAVTGICHSGAGAIGGDLYVSRDLATWERVQVVPEGFSDAMNQGNGIKALVVQGGRAYVAVTSGTTDQWFSSSDGRDWQKSVRRNVPRAPQALARTLAVETIHGVHDTPEASFAWTSDGLFRKRGRGADAGGWTRIFPR